MTTEKLDRIAQEAQKRAQACGMTEHSELWKLGFYRGDEEVETEENVCGPTRIQELAWAAWEEVKDQGCTKLTVTRFTSAATRAGAEIAEIVATLS